MSEMNEQTRRDIKERQKLLDQDRKIANRVAQRVLSEVGSVGQKIPATGRWSRGTTTERGIMIAQQDLVGQGIYTHIEYPQDSVTSYEHSQYEGDESLPHPVFVVDELDDTMRQSRRRDKR